MKAITKTLQSVMFHKVKQVQDPKLCQNLGELELQTINRAHSQNNTSKGV